MNEGSKTHRRIKAQDVMASRVVSAKLLKKKEYQSFPYFPPPKKKLKRRKHFQLKSFRRAKDTVDSAKRQPAEWEKLLTNHTSHKRLTSKIYKEFKNSQQE